VNLFPLKNNLLLGIIVLLYTSSSLAERADREKPLQLDADQVMIDDIHQTSTFSGAVKLTQGTLQLLGDKVVVVQNKDGFTRATVYGKPASFHQKREGLNEFVEGSGERIVYDTRAETVDFYNQARVKRDMDDIRGERISYSVKTEIFQVTGDNENSGNTEPKRVRAVLQSKIRKTIPPAQTLPNETSTSAQ